MTVLAVSSQIRDILTVWAATTLQVVRQMAPCRFSCLEVRIIVGNMALTNLRR